MLVLSRKVGESIHIGNDIVVTVVKICGGKIRLGIDAPRHIPVMRSEVDKLKAFTHHVDLTTPIANLEDLDA